MIFENLRCLSIQQPWAGAIMRERDRKNIENRGWAPRKGLVDGWFVVHASSTLADTSGFDEGRLYTGRSDLSMSAILGMAHVERVVDLNRELHQQGDPPLNGNPWAFGPVCWVIDEVIRLDRPLVGVPGAMGLWPLGGTRQHVARHGDRTAERVEALRAAWERRAA